MEILTNNRAQEKLAPVISIEVLEESADMPANAAAVISAKNHPPFSRQS